MTEGCRVKATPRDWPEDGKGGGLAVKKRKKAQEFRSGFNHGWTRMRRPDDGRRRAGGPTVRTTEGRCQMTDGGGLAAKKRKRRKNRTL